MIQAWSFSSLKLLHSCPLSWYAKYVCGERTPQSEAASFGSQFDQLIARRLGILGIEAVTNPVPGVEEAVEFYLTHRLSWKHASDAQVPVNIDPDQWAQIGERLGVVVRIDRPIVGYVDLIRRDAASVGTPIIQHNSMDLKTSSRAEFRPEWVLQQGLYALDPALNIVDLTVHLLVRTKQIKLLEYRYRPTTKTKLSVLSTISWLAELAGKLEQAKSEDEIAQMPGYHCEWCPRSATCEASNFRTPGVTE